MSPSLRDLVRWTEKPARNVEAGTGSPTNLLRGLAARATTPLLPDDYLTLLNPLWSARELRGEVVGQTQGERADQDAPPPPAPHSARRSR